MCAVDVSSSEDADRVSVELSVSSRAWVHVPALEVSSGEESALNVALPVPCHSDPRPTQSTRGSNWFQAFKKKQKRLASQLPRGTKKQRPAAAPEEVRHVPKCDGQVSVEGQALVTTTEHPRSRKTAKDSVAVCLPHTAFTAAGTNKKRLLVPGSLQGDTGPLPILQILGAQRISGVDSAAAAKPLPSTRRAPGAQKRILKARGGDRQRASRSARPAPVGSFSFLAKESSVGTHDEAVTSNDKVSAGPCASGSVEAFVTVAGRAGKGGSVTESISVDEVAQHVPVSFISNFMPTPFADHLCRAFLEETKRWHTSKRWLYDKEIESHRLESGFRFGASGACERHFGPRWEAAGFGDDLRHLRSMISSGVQRARADLQTWRGQGQGALKATDLAQEKVRLASRGQKLDARSAEWLVHYSEEFAHQGWRWEPNFCVTNFYADQSDFLGAHSDPVESIGPWAIVASMTLGASRHFRMKPVNRVRSHREAGGRITSFSIRLPHNSLLICWEGFQEFWRHEVPKDNQLKPHPITGPARLNFTFRKTVGSLFRRRPLCKCGRKARLKPVLKETRNRGRYFWSCQNPRMSKGTYSTCDFFQWDDELVRDLKANSKPKPPDSARLASVQRGGLEPPGTSRAASVQRGGLKPLDSPRPVSVQEGGLGPSDSARPASVQGSWLKHLDSSGPVSVHEGGLGPHDPIAISRPASMPEGGLLQRSVSWPVVLPQQRSTWEQSCLQTHTTPRDVGVASCEKLPEAPPLMTSGSLTRAVSWPAIPPEQNVVSMEESANGTEELDAAQPLGTSPRPLWEDFWRRSDSSSVRGSSVPGQNNVEDRVPQRVA